MPEAEMWDALSKVDAKDDPGQDIWYLKVKILNWIES